MAERVRVSTFGEVEPLIHTDGHLSGSDRGAARQSGDTLWATAPKWQSIDSRAKTQRRRGPGTGQSDPHSESWRLGVLSEAGAMFSDISVTLHRSWAAKPFSHLRMNADPTHGDARETIVPRWQSIAELARVSAFGGVEPLTDHANGASSKMSSA